MGYYPFVTKVALLNRFPIKKKILPPMEGEVAQLRNFSCNYSGRATIAPIGSPLEYRL